MTKHSNPSTVSMLLGQQ